jgi:hypothetical protein
MSREREGAGTALGRADVLGMLASYGDRAPADVAEELGSLEVTWLVAQVEQRYAVLLDLDDDAFAAMSTVTGAVGVLRSGLGQPATDPARDPAGDRSGLGAGVADGVVGAGDG